MHVYLVYMTLAVHTLTIPLLCCFIKMYRCDCGDHTAELMNCKKCKNNRRILQDSRPAVWTSVLLGSFDQVL